MRLWDQRRPRDQQPHRLPTGPLSAAPPPARRRPDVIVADAAGFDAAVSALNAGEVVGLPTETVYGLAVVPAITGAVDRLFAAKGRPGSVPVAVLVADGASAASLAAEALPRSLVTRHWPGPLTLVVRRREDLDWDLGGDPETIGLRCPDHDLARRLCEAVGPIATTSANAHGQPTPSSAHAVAEALGGGSVALILDGGDCAGAPSTVVDLTGDVPVILREGALGESDLGI